jgi:pimeloyl-ACP methyl ester carboxylesterase
MAAAASRVTCPVTVIAGRHDAATPPARAEEIAAAIPQARLVTLDAAHVSALERPEAFARAVREAAREAAAAAGLSRAT